MLGMERMACQMLHHWHCRVSHRLFLGVIAGGGLETGVASDMFAEGRTGGTRHIEQTATKHGMHAVQGVPAEDLAHRLPGCICDSICDIHAVCKSYYHYHGYCWDVSSPISRTDYSGGKGDPSRIERPAG
jgi:hypothetical protein